MAKSGIGQILCDDITLFMLANGLKGRDTAMLSTMGHDHILGGGLAQGNVTDKPQI